MLPGFALAVSSDRRSWPYMCWRCAVLHFVLRSLVKCCSHGFASVNSEEDANSLRNLGTHQRSVLFPQGNEGYPSVQIGNRLASRTSLLMYFSCAHEGRPVLEQPRNSKAPLHPRLEQVLEELPFYETSIWGGKYADNPQTSTPKRHSLFSVDKCLLQKLSDYAGTMTAEELQAFETTLVKRRRKDDGSYSWSGNENMKQSQFSGKI